MNLKIAQNALAKTEEALTSAVGDWERQTYTHQDIHPPALLMVR